ncbi:NAD-dependent epimerase/dehydratase family protein [Microvirga arabica]|uniref:NAD-dependent epimerase/dehydratase family protein n=1 Tax=Microvirga arabica TaxID=1128671 RepID=A0ABV6YE77_9HYPH
MKTAADVVSADLDFITRSLEYEFSQMAGKRLLIVGGGGFLGYYLVQSALAWNRRGKTAPITVVVFDNWARGVPSWIERLRSSSFLTLRTHDVTQRLPADIGAFDYIIHAASIASPIFYRQFPIETMDANVNGLRHLLEFALQLKYSQRSIDGFLFYSTSEIYGDPTPENVPTAESYRGNVSCTGPRACYDESKRYGETLCVNFAQQHGLPIKIARPFNNYGPGLKITDRRVLPDYARDVLAGKDINMLSDGSPTRTFCYISDAIIGYYKILVRGRPGEAYNIGTPEPEISMLELAERIVALSRSIFGYTGRIVRQVSNDANYLVDNPNRRCPIIDKARHELDYNPKIELDDGLQRSLLWYSENRTAEDR